MANLLKKSDSFYEGLWGTDIKTVLSDGIAIARTEKKSVTILFRNIEILINPDVTPDEAYAAWCQLIRPKILAS